MISVPRRASYCYEGSHRYLGQHAVFTRKSNTSFRSNLIPPSRGDINVLHLVTLSAFGRDVVLSSRDGHERILLAGFPVAEIPVIRRTLDDSGGYHIDMIVSSPGIMHSPLQRVFEETPPIEWLKPIPGDWIDGQGWGQMRVILFGPGVPHVHQLDVIQILHDIGISRLYSGSADILMDDNEVISVADALAQAVQCSQQDDELYSKEDFIVDEEDDDDYMQESVTLEDLEYEAIDEIFSSHQEKE